MDFNNKIRFEKAIHNLEPYFGKMTNNNDAFVNGAAGAVYEAESFRLSSIKRSFLSDCTFLQCDFTEASTTGSTFIKCKVI